MASFAIRTEDSRFDTPSYAEGDVNFYNISKSTLTFTRYSDQTLIYCNSPEIVENNTGESGFYLNKATVITPNFLIFASYDTSVSPATKFAIRAYNPGISDVTISTTHRGFESKRKDGSGFDIACYSYTKYHNTVTPITHTIAPNTSEWIFTDNLADYGLAEFMGSYTTTDTVTIAVYVCNDTANVPGITYAVPQNDGKQYSGTATASSIETSHTLKSVDLLNSSHSSAFFGLSQAVFSGNAGERM